MRLNLPPFLDPKNPALIFFSMVILILFSTTDVFGVTTQSLRAPMQDLKKEVFEWMFAVKIAAAAVGGVFSVVKQSLTPFGVGGGIAAGIHFFDKWIGDGTAALIDVI